MYPAPAPIATLLSPVTTPSPIEASPIETLLLAVVAFAIELLPTETLPIPVVNEKLAKDPTAVFSPASAPASKVYSAFLPIAVLEEPSTDVRRAS